MDRDLLFRAVERDFDTACVTKSSQLCWKFLHTLINVSDGLHLGMRGKFLEVGKECLRREEIPIDAFRAARAHDIDSEMQRSDVACRCSKTRQLRGTEFENLQARSHSGQDGGVVHEEITGCQVYELQVLENVNPEVQKSCHAEDVAETSGVGETKEGWRKGPSDRFARKGG